MNTRLTVLNHSDMIVSDAIRIFVESKDKKTEELEKLLADIALISAIARREGLLELEIYANEMEINEFADVIKKELLMLIVDGADPDLIGEIFFNKYLLLVSAIESGIRPAIDAIKFALVFKGILMIQAGENTLIIAELLSSMFTTYEYDIEKWRKSEISLYSNPCVQSAQKIVDNYKEEKEKSAAASFDKNISSVKFQKEITADFVEKINLGNILSALDIEFLREYNIILSCSEIEALVLAYQDACNVLLNEEINSTTVIRQIKADIITNMLWFNEEYQIRDEFTVCDELMQAYIKLESLAETIGFKIPLPSRESLEKEYEMLQNYRKQDEEGNEMDILTEILMRG